MGHSQWSGYGDKVFQHVLFLDLGSIKSQIHKAWIQHRHRRTQMKPSQGTVQTGASAQHTPLGPTTEPGSINVCINNLKHNPLPVKHRYNGSVALAGPTTPPGRTFMASAVKGCMIRRMSSTSWLTFLPIWPRWKTKEWGTVAKDSSCRWLACTRFFFWFLD